MIGLSSVVLVAVVVAVAVGVNKNNNQSSSSGGGGSGISTSNKAVKAMCNNVDYKDACEESLSNTNSTDPKELIKVGFEVAVNDLKSAIGNSTTLKDAAKDPRTSDAYGICKDLLETAVDDLHRSFDKVGSFDVSKLDDYVADLKTWLSGTVTYQDTCIDAFQNTSGDAGEKMKKLLKTSSELSSNALAMVNELGSMLSSLQIPELNRRLLSHEEGEDEQKRHLYESEDPGVGWSGKTSEQRQLFESEDPGFGWSGSQDRHLTEDDPEQSTLPGWIDKTQRHLLQAAPKPNAVVAQDGSGQFKTINDAVKTAPQKSLQPFVIFIKAGIYKEYVDIPRHVNNVVFVGEGATKTKITGNKNFIDGINTYRTSTVCT